MARLISVCAPARPRSRKRGCPKIAYLSMANGRSTVHLRSRMACAVARAFIGRTGLNWRVFFCTNGEDSHRCGASRRTDVWPSSVCWPNRQIFPRSEVVCRIGYRSLGHHHGRDLWITGGIGFSDNQLISSDSQQDRWGLRTIPEFN